MKVLTTTLAVVALGISFQKWSVGDCGNIQEDRCGAAAECILPGDPEEGECVSRAYSGPNDIRYMKLKEVFIATACKSVTQVENLDPTYMYFCGQDPDDPQRCSEWEIFPTGADDCDEPFSTIQVYGVPNICDGDECVIVI